MGTKQSKPTPKVISPKKRKASSTTTYTVSIGLSNKDKIIEENQAQKRIPTSTTVTSSASSLSVSPYFTISSLPNIPNLELNNEMKESFLKLDSGLYSEGLLNRYYQIERLQLFIDPIFCNQSNEIYNLEFDFYSLLYQILCDIVMNEKFYLLTLYRSIHMINILLRSLSYNKYIIEEDDYDKEIVNGYNNLPFLDDNYNSHLFLFSKFFKELYAEFLYTYNKLYSENITEIKDINQEDFLHVFAYYISSSCLSLCLKLEETETFDSESYYYDNFLGDYKINNKLLNEKYNKEFVYIIEKKIFLLLNFNINFPTSYNFLTIYEEIFKLDSKQKNLMKLLIGLTYTDPSFNYFLASHIAAAALFLTLQITNPDNNDIWNQNFSSITRCNEINLVEIVLKIHNLHWNMEKSPIYENLIVNFLESPSLIGADIPSPSYSNLKFSNQIKKLIPIDENSFEFIDYKVKGRIENKAFLQQNKFNEEINTINLIEIIK